MRKDQKKTSKSKRAKKAETKDLTVRNPATVKGGSFTVTKRVDKSSPTVF